VKFPRDISGEELARILERHGYKITRQTGSHIRLTSTIKGTEHHVTIPRHMPEIVHQGLGHAPTQGFIRHLSLRYAQLR